MRIFTTKFFRRFAKENDLSEEALCRAVRELSMGLVHTSLGGHVYKQRVARKGEGKSGGFRTIIFFKFEEVAFFAFGFAKNVQDNIDRNDLAGLKNLAKELFSYDETALSLSIKVANSAKSVPHKYRSPILAAVHETASGLYQAGSMTRKTMRNFDKSCLTPVKPLSPRQIAAIRKKEDVSKNVFANYLGLSVTIISQWERGEKKPQGSSLKLLTLVKKHGLDFVA